MKKIRLYLLGLVLAVAGVEVEAAERGNDGDWHARKRAPLTADMLKVQDLEVKPGESAAINIELENETANLMGWQCDIVLPEGLTLALKNNGKPIAVLGERFATTEHSISSSRLANGTYRFIGTSMQGEAIPGNSGTLFTVTLQADAALDELQSLERLRVGDQRSGMASPTTPQRSEALPTTLTGKVMNIEFNTQDNQKLTFDDVTITVTIPAKEQQKCAMPTITYDKGELVFSCDTEDASFVSEVKVADAKANGSQRVQLTACYVVTVYATANGYADSDVATATLTFGDSGLKAEGLVIESTKDKKGDINGDGSVNVADVITVFNIMAGVE